MALGKTVSLQQGAARAGLGQNTQLPNELTKNTYSI